VDRTQQHAADPLALKRWCYGQNMR
jgi:hypothetical protein